MDFEQWFAGYLQQDESQIEKLLNDRTAISFMITWSIFESKCFKGFFKLEKLPTFAKKISKKYDVVCAETRETAAHFHKRYQDKQLYKNLINSQKTDGIKEVLSKSFDQLSSYELVYMLIFIVSRFRNNIFHGNKRVQSWLNYKEQIILCQHVMQTIISAELQLTRKG